MAIDHTILVNRDHPIPEGYSDGIALVELPVEEGFSVPMEEETAGAFLRLQGDLAREGLRMEPLSGYRSADTQRRILEDFLRSRGEEYTLSHVAAPGHSEHQTGLALDVTLYDAKGDPVEDDHAPEYDRLFPRLHEYGFILRYPEGAEAVTGYAFEPWHIRYVGIPAATAIHENHWTLEEYAEKRRL